MASTLPSDGLFVEPRLHTPRSRTDGFRRLVKPPLHIFPTFFPSACIDVVLIDIIGKEVHHSHLVGTEVHLLLDARYAEYRCHRQAGKHHQYRQRLQPVLNHEECRQGYHRPHDVGAEHPQHTRQAECYEPQQIPAPLVAEVVEPEREHRHRNIMRGKCRTVPKNLSEQCTQYRDRSYHGRHYGHPARHSHRFEEYLTVAHHSRRKQCHKQRIDILQHHAHAITGHGRVGKAYQRPRHKHEIQHHRHAVYGSPLAVKYSQHAQHFENGKPYRQHRHNAHDAGCKNEHQHHLRARAGHQLPTVVGRAQVAHRRIQ